MSSEPCKPSFQTYLALNWLVTVLGMNNFDRILKNYQSGLASLTAVKKSQNDRYFSAHFLPLVKTQELRIVENYLIVRPNIQNYCQQWYQQPCNLVCLLYGLIACLTDWLQYQWRIMMTENWLITKAVRPPSIWQTNFKTTVLSVLTSYLCLNFFSVWLNLMHWLVFCLKYIYWQQWQNNFVVIMIPILLLIW